MKAGHHLPATLQTCDSCNGHMPASAMTSGANYSPSSRPRGTRRCVERCCPSAAQVRRSETCKCTRTCSMRARRRAGLMPKLPDAGALTRHLNGCLASVDRPKKQKGSKAHCDDGNCCPGRLDQVRCERQHLSNTRIGPFVDPGIR